MAPGKRSTAEDALGGQSLAGTTAIVTGATSGIGTETARVLAAAGARVVLAVRNLDAGQALAAQLGGATEARRLDLNDLSSVRTFVEGWHGAVHLLINNAGLMATPQAQTAQGFELQVGTNHLAHFALTLGLLPSLRAGSRVVTLSSLVHARGVPERLLAALEKKPTRYSPFGAYADSKLANVLFTQALTKRLPPGAHAFAVHPGVVGTNITRSLPGVIDTAWRYLRPLFVKTVPQGAATTLYAAVSPSLDGRSGAYLADCAEKQPGRVARNPALAEQLWAVSEHALRQFQ